MAKLEKDLSGLLLYEDFKEQNLIWLPSPDNYNNINFTQSGLEITHSDMYKTITIQKPDEDNFIFSCKINHNPIDKTDIGGVIIISDKKTYIECQSYLANEESYITNSDRYEEVLKQELEKYINHFVTYSIISDTGAIPDDGITDDPTHEKEPFYDEVYPYIRVINHGYTYAFLASTDGINWVELGSGSLDANRIGFFLYSHNENGNLNPFYVEYAAIYKSNYIIINNVPSDCTIEAITTRNGYLDTLFNEKNQFVKRKNNQIYIDTTLIECPINEITLNIKRDDEVILSKDVPQLAGGDVFTMWYDIDMYIDQQKINPNELYDLGMFINEITYVRVDLFNNENFNVTNIQVEIKKYSDYYVGDENIGIAIYEQGKTDYTFKDKIIIDKIDSFESKSFVIGLTNRLSYDFYNMINDKRFKILLSNL